MQANLKPTTTNVSIALDFFGLSIQSVHDTIKDGLPESRERSLALTKLEEAWLWTQQAVLTNQEHFSPGLAAPA